ncbi:hypothetical protein cyc_08701 [Cyclospora cayetanensis]|uniref:Uncharacterized protein n=1 Tax=Cyclospora cayetanensis TaxID=88456 RepID=A0A1D3D298_9EIME|nr:hypothetical protein cyc_08701 [Cyclospora cayetanensis]
MGSCEQDRQQQYCRIGRHLLACDTTAAEGAPSDAQLIQWSFLSLSLPCSCCSAPPPSELLLPLACSSKNFAALKLQPQDLVAATFSCCVQQLKRDKALPLNPNRMWKPVRKRIYKHACWEYANALVQYQRQQQEEQQSGSLCNEAVRQQLDTVTGASAEATATSGVVATAADLAAKGIDVAALQQLLIRDLCGRFFVWFYFDAPPSQEQEEVASAPVQQFAEMLDLEMLLNPEDSSSVSGEEAEPQPGSAATAAAGDAASPTREMPAMPIEATVASAAALSVVLSPACGQQKSVSDCATIPSQHTARVPQAQQPHMQQHPKKRSCIDSNSSSNCDESKGTSNKRQRPSFKRVEGPVAEAEAAGAAPTATTEGSGDEVAVILSDDDAGECKQQSNQDPSITQQEQPFPLQSEQMEVEGDQPQQIQQPRMWQRLQQEVSDVFSGPPAGNSDGSIASSNSNTTNCAEDKAEAENAAVQNSAPDVSQGLSREEGPLAFESALFICWWAATPSGSSPVAARLPMSVGKAHHQCTPYYPWRGGRASGCSLGETGGAGAPASRL